jgi:hypothetical protein
MEYSESLKKDYPDIIGSTEFKYPENYEIIHFDKFIDRIFPNLNAFISSEIIGEIQGILKRKYGNLDNCIKDNGNLTYVKFEELKYYQPTVGINGPKYHQIDDPVYVIKYDDKTILFNGYHRALIHLLNNQVTINAYLLVI